jgi:membrane associated rhomboid family serine protease
MPPEKRDEYDWIELVVRLGTSLGMNPVRIRWKLRTWQDRQKGRGQRVIAGARAVGRDHKICPACKGINGSTEKVCVHCGARLRGRVGEMAARILRRFNLGLGAETILVGVFILAYTLVVTRGGASTIWSLDATDLVRAGGNFHSVDPGVAWSQVAWNLRPTLEGQYFRLLTYAFLHGGILHLGFNCLALLIVTPAARDVYGGSRALVAFVGTAILAGAFSLAWAVLTHRDLVSIGASGGISGLIGLMAVWGHLDRTRAGIAVRNAMLRWVLYTFVFGFVAGTDHAAHVGGLVGGALLAMALPTLPRRVEDPAWRAAGLVAAVLCAGAVALSTWMILG